MSVDRVIIRTGRKDRRIVIDQLNAIVQWRNGKGEWYSEDAQDFPNDYPAGLIALLEAAESMIAAQARDLRESLKPDTATEF